MTTATYDLDLGHAHHPTYRHPAHRPAIRTRPADRRQQPINPALQMPAPRDGAFLADHQDPRPCVTNPPQWWETGNPENATATELCRTACPLYGTGTCKPGRREVGMIRDGIPYDDDGHAIRPKSDVAQHHHRIVAMLGQGRTLKQIASVIGIKSTTIQTYLDEVAA